MRLPHEASALLVLLILLAAAPPSHPAQLPDGGDTSGGRGVVAALSVGIVVGVDDGYEAWSDAATVAWAVLHPPILAASAGLRPSVRLFCLGGGAAETGEVPAGTRAVECPSFLWGEDGTGQPLSRHPAASEGETLAEWAGQRDVVVSIGRVVARDLCVALAHRRTDPPAGGGARNASRVGCVAVAARGDGGGSAGELPGQDTWWHSRGSELEVWVQGPEAEQAMRAARRIRQTDAGLSEQAGGASARGAGQTGQIVGGGGPRVVLVPWSVPDFVAHAAPLAETGGGQAPVAAGLSHMMY